MKLLTISDEIIALCKNKIILCMKYSVCIEWELACFTLIKRLLCSIHKNYLLSVMLFFAQFL